MLGNLAFNFGRWFLDHAFGWLPDAGSAPQVIEQGFRSVARFFYQFDFIVSFYDLLTCLKTILLILAIEQAIYLFASFYKRVPIVGK